MKIIIFNILVITGLNAFAGQPTWTAPSEQHIAKSALSDMHMSVSNVIVNELENPFHGANQKELFFDYQGVTYNCAITFPDHIFFNPEMNGYSVHRISISSCTNYSSGEAAEPVTINLMRTSAFFREGVIFLENNRSFIVNPYGSSLYNR